MDQVLFKRLQRVGNARGLFLWLAGRPAGESLTALEIAKLTGYPASRVMQYAARLRNLGLVNTREYMTIELKNGNPPVRRGRARG
jgi:DNA-binding IclR family transcriptional regulator